MKFTSYDGEIELEGAVLKIKKNEDDVGHIVRLSDVIYVTLLKPRLGVEGYLHIQLRGAKTYSSNAIAMNYVTERHAIGFRKQQYDDAILFKEAIEQAMIEN